MKLLSLGLVGCLFLAAILHAQDDPEVLLREGQEAFRQSETDPNAIVTAATKFTAALEIYEQRKDDQACTKINSFLFWCRRRMSDRNINDFLRDTKNSPVATRLEATKKPVPATDAKVYFDRAEKFAAENPTDSLSIAALYFEVAERFIGTPVSLEAQRKSLDYQQRAFKAMGEKPNKAVPPKEAATAPAKRLPIPDANAQKGAEKLIKEVFKEDYVTLAKATPDEKYAFSQKLLKQADESKDDKTALYVLWKEANTLAAQSGKIGLALSIADQMGQVYDINVTDLRKKTLQTACRASNDGELLKAMNAMLILEDKPNDGDANLVVGKYYCFQKDNWIRGLPYLSKSSEPTLQKLAEADLAGPTDAATQAAVGDGWWDLADKESGKQQKPVLQGRARIWYEKAVPSLNGLNKAKVEKRIATLPRGKSIDLLRIIDPQRDKVSGEWTMQGGKLVCVTKQTENGRLDIPYTAPVEYDLKVVFSKESGCNIYLIGAAGDKRLAWQVGYNKGRHCSFGKPLSSKAVNETEVNLGRNALDGQKHTIIMQVRKDGFKTLFDGTVLNDLKTDFVMWDISKSDKKGQEWWQLRNSTSLGLGAGNERTIYYELELVEVGSGGNQKSAVSKDDAFAPPGTGKVEAPAIAKDEPSKPLVTLTANAKGITLEPFDIGARWHPGRDYHVTKYPEEMKGGSYLKGAKWVELDQVVVSRDCTIYLAVLYQNNDSIRVTPEQFDIMTKAGWVMLNDEFATSVLNKQIWKCHVLKKQIPAGTVTLGNTAKISTNDIMFVLK